jgi:hypothetical protein
VGQTADVVIRVDDYGAPPGGAAQIGLRVGGVDAGSRFAPTGRDITLHIPVSHEGENVLEIEARPGPAELTLANNRAVVTVYGVRDRLRVLLISGQPHAGERVWRSLLKADPSVHPEAAGQAGRDSDRPAVADRVSHPRTIRGEA